jgi:hypothetical protein
VSAHSQRETSPISHHLTFLALGGFLIAFFGARVFTTIFPHTVVITSGIHFHHFWYGLGMVLVAGWLGITSTLPLHRRAYAIIFGLGGGLIGDEVGLFLTFGNYYSDLTYFFAVGFLALAALALLVIRYWGALKVDLFGTGLGETLLHWGILVSGLSVLAFSFGDLALGSVILVVGVLIASIGYYFNSRYPRLTLKTIEGRT